MEQNGRTQKETVLKWMEKRTFLLKTQQLYWWQQQRPGERKIASKGVRENNFQPRIVYQVKVSFKNEGRIKINVLIDREWETPTTGPCRIIGN